MLSKLNDKKIKLLYQVNREWNERIFRYEIKEYQKDCQEFIRIFCEIEKIEIPVIVFFDSPLASLFAVEFIKSIYWSGEYSGDWIDDEMIQEVWMKVSEHPLVELNNTSETMRTAISKSVLNALNNCVWDINYKEKDCSNCLIDGKYWVSQNTIFKPDIDYCIYKRNMEHIKTKISYHIWEVITPTWDKDDYMLNSFNYGVGANILTGLENRIASVDDSMVPISFKTYNWFPIYDFMSRAGIMKDELFNSLRKIMLNGVYDFYWYNQFCFITTLPTKICRNEKGNFHSLDGAAVKFIDGYSNYNLDGREFPAWIWEAATIAVVPPTEPAVCTRNIGLPTAPSASER